MPSAISGSDGQSQVRRSAARSGDLAVVSLQVFPVGSRVEDFLGSGKVQREPNLLRRARACYKNVHVGSRRTFPVDLD
jgi:hypothetical protein